MTIGNPAFCLFFYLTGVHIFEASYSTLVTSVSKKSSVDQSELEKYVVSDCKTNYMHYGFEIWVPVSNDVLISSLIYNTEVILVSDKTDITGRYQPKKRQNIFQHIKISSFLGSIISLKLFSS